MMNSSDHQEIRVQEKVCTLINGQAIPDPTECFAVRGKMMIDLVHPLTGRTAIYSRTLEECQADPDYQGAERMTIAEFCQSKADTQDTPIAWEPVTEELYYEMLEVLPPAYMGHGGFLVGEPWDHHAMTGRPRFAAYRKRGDIYETASRPMTIQEMKAT